MHSAFSRQQTVGVSPFHRKRPALYACLLARSGLQELGAEALALAPPEIHAEERVGPVLRVRPPLPGVYLDDRGMVVEFSAE